MKLIGQAAAKRLITKDEVLRAFQTGAGKIAPDADGHEKRGRNFNLSDILYYIGGAIVVIGISILIWQHWSTFNIVTKILVTLGVGLAAYLVGVFLSQDEKYSEVSRAFFLIFSLVTPFGLSVTLDYAGLDVGSNSVHSAIFGLVLLAELVSYWIYKKNVFLVFAVIFGTGLFFALTNLMIQGNPIVFEWKFFEYRALVVGLTYLMFGHTFAGTDKKPLTGPLYGFGSLIFLGSAMALGGWNPNQNVFWELAFPGLVFGIIFASVHLKSKALLTFGFIFLMGYILKITSEYFAHSLGWATALIIAGLVLIGVGYLAVYLNKKYLRA